MWRIQARAATGFLIVVHPMTVLQGLSNMPRHGDPILITQMAVGAKGGNIRDLLAVDG